MMEAEPANLGTGLPFFEQPLVSLNMTTAHDLVANNYMVIFSRCMLPRKGFANTEDA
jgi:hypothetical protein